MRSRMFGAIVGAAAVGASCPAFGDVVAIGSDRDNTLIEDGGGAVSNGAGEQFFVGRINLGTLRRGVIRFNVAGAVPAGSTITGVTLKLNMTQSIVGDKVVSLHLLGADWGEGTSSGSGTGAPSTPGDATWIHRFFPGAFWATPGGDFAATASASQTVGLSGAYVWSSPAMATDAQGWLNNPATNFGWLVKGDESGGTSAKRFEARESLTTGLRPLLQITFTPPTPPCPADRDHNGSFEPADVAAFISDWFTSLVQGTLLGDFDGNLAVQPADVAAFVTAWFTALSTGSC